MQDDGGEPRLVMVRHSEQIQRLFFALGEVINRVINCFAYAAIVSTSRSILSFNSVSAIFRS